MQTADNRSLSREWGKKMVRWRKLITWRAWKKLALFPPKSGRCFNYEQPPTPNTTFYTCNMMGWMQSLGPVGGLQLPRPRWPANVESDDGGGNRSAGFRIRCMARTFLWLGWLMSNLYRALCPSDKWILIDTLPIWSRLTDLIYRIIIDGAI